MELCGGFRCVYGSCVNSTCVCDPGFEHDISMGTNYDCSVPVAVMTVVYIYLSIINFVGACTRGVSLLKTLHRKNRQFTNRFYTILSGFVLSFGEFFYIFFLKVLALVDGESYWNIAAFLIPGTAIYAMGGFLMKSHFTFTNQYTNAQSTRITYSIFSGYYCHIFFPLSCIVFIDLANMIFHFTNANNYDGARHINYSTFIFYAGRAITLVIFSYYVRTNTAIAYNALDDFGKNKANLEEENQRARIKKTLKTTIMTQRYLQGSIFVYFLLDCTSIFSYLKYNYIRYHWVSISTTHILFSLEFLLSVCFYKRKRTREKRIKHFATTVAPRTSNKSKFVFSSTKADPAFSSADTVVMSENGSKNEDEDEDEK